MPTICMFYGIIIRMYCSPGEHNPPHFHAYYQNFKAIIDIDTCEVHYVLSCNRSKAVGGI